MVGQPEKGRLKTRKLIDYTLGLYASASYLADRPAPQRREDLAQHRLIGFVEDLIPNPQLNYTREIWKDWRTAYEISSAMGQIAAVQAGAGIGVLHDFMVQDAPDLRPILPHICIARSYWIVWHASSADSAAIRCVIDYLIALTQPETARFSRQIDVAS